MAKNSGDLIDTIITLLFIFFFFFSGFFKKGKKKGEKKPYKPIFPPIQEEGDQHHKKRAAPPQKSVTAETLTDVFAKALEKLGEAKDYDEMEGEKRRTLEPEPFSERFEEETETKIWVPPEFAAKKVAPPKRKMKKLSGDEAELLKKRREKKKQGLEKRKERKAYTAESKERLKKTPYNSLFSGSGIRDAIVMAEVLDRPMALRGRRSHFGR